MGGPGTTAPPLTMALLVSEKQDERFHQNTAGIRKSIGGGQFIWPEGRFEKAAFSGGSYRLMEI